ncbi:hypothetical protein HHI36_002013 [Cryptolaemus montrouzieri]|uniref:Peptidase S1 domain-containing protein n=1 Tax=Cryptolaemus montrouzieri TaxID=559131 RepID=A0ABD2P9Q4_9CUCU
MVDGSSLIASVIITLFNIAFANFKVEYPNISNYPYMVSIRSNEGPFKHFCSGSLIRSQWVLTSAYCMNNSPAVPNLMVTGVQTRDVRKIFYHEEFNPTQLLNDIALVLLHEPFQLTVKVCSIPLYRMDISMKSKCKTIEVLGFEDNILVKYKHTIISDKQCSEREGTEFTVNNFCGTAENMTSCSRDSGGPAVCRDFCFGVTIYGCPWEGSYSFFTRVDRYLNFLKKTMKEDLSSLKRRVFLEKRSASNFMGFGIMIGIIIILLIIVCLTFGIPLRSGQQFHLVRSCPICSLGGEKPYSHSPFGTEPIDLPLENQLLLTALHVWDYFARAPFDILKHLYRMDMHIGLSLLF